LFKHEKQLFHPVGVERPNPQYAALLQERACNLQKLWYNHDTFRNPFRGTACPATT